MLHSAYIGVYGQLFQQLERRELYSEWFLGTTHKGGKLSSFVASQPRAGNHSEGDASGNLLGNAAGQW